MAICLKDGEIYSVQKGTLNRSGLLTFLSEHRENLIAVYESEKYQGMISYESLLQTTSIEDALIRDKVYLDENIWINVSDVLSRYPYVSYIPILADDDRILYLAENNPELTALMIKLCSLEKDDGIWQEISSIKIKGINEAFFYFIKFLEGKDIPVFVEEEAWEKLGVVSDQRECPADVQIVAEDGEWINSLYAKSTKKNDLEEFCKEVKENDFPVVFCSAPDAVSEMVYDSLLREGIFPRTVWCLEPFRTLYGEKVMPARINEGDVYCLAGKKEDAFCINAMFESIIQKQNGYCDNIYVLSEIGYNLPDTMLSHMIRHCGKVVLMGEKRLCSLLEKYCQGLGEIEVAYAGDKEQMAESMHKGADALWFWLDFPIEKSQKYTEHFEVCRQNGIYLSRYFLDHYMYYGDTGHHTCFTQDELDAMMCLQKLQVMRDECRTDFDTQVDIEREVLFFSSVYAYLWSGVVPLFKYYIKQGNTRCTVVFPPVWEILKIGNRNLREMADRISEIRSCGGEAYFYNHWYPDKKYDVCYLSLGYSAWHDCRIGSSIRKTSKAIISLQVQAYHTHYYLGNKIFQDMFQEHHREQIDYAAVSRFMAEWAGQKEEKWREKLLPIGYPRMDGLYDDLQNSQIPDEWKRVVDGKRVILFITYYYPDVFECCSKYCENDKMVLVWRPHPFGSDSPHTREGIEEMNNKKNVIVDMCPTYSAAFSISDAMVTDYFTSVKINYLFTDKPILVLDKGFLGQKDNKIDFQEEAWYKAVYTANTSKEYEEFIDMIMDGRDDKREEKLPYRQFMQQGFDGKVCERIAEFVEQRFGRAEIKKDIDEADV